MTHGSLFSGIGGFDLAAEWVGWKNIFQVEIDDFCNKVLEKHFPDTLRFRDIFEFNERLRNGEIITDTKSSRWDYGKQFNGEIQNEKGKQYVRNLCKNDKSINIGHIDIITGGFPCQPFSQAGKRKGTDDSRYLWPEMLTTIRIVKPSFVVGENVAGLVSMENGKTLDRILADLANEGYQTESFIIPACGIGAWHRRDRIWIIAYNEGFGLCCQEKDGKLERGFRSSEFYQRNGKSVSNMWSTESNVGRVAHGVSRRVDRLKSLGNAVVPQVAYEIFKAIDSL